MIGVQQRSPFAPERSMLTRPDRTLFDASCSALHLRSKPGERPLPPTPPAIHSSQDHRSIPHSSFKAAGRLGSRLPFLLLALACQPAEETVGPAEMGSRPAGVDRA